MSVKETAIDLLRRSGALPYVKRAYRVLTRRTTPPPPAPRMDPVPALQSFPQARYIFVVGAIPRQYAGRTASIFAKTKLLYEQAGIRSEILTMNYSGGRLKDITRQARERGTLSEGVTVVNLHEFFGQQAEVSGEPVVHPVEEPGMDAIRDANQEVYRYFDNGVYRLYKRFDNRGRLIVRDTFNENRARTQRDEFYPSGIVRRTTFFDLHHNKPRQEVYYRQDGTPYLNKWLVLEGDPLSPRLQRITLFDAAGQPTDVLTSHIDLIHTYLDRVIGDDNVFLTVEARRADAEVLGYRRPNVKQLYVLHNPHIAPPFTNPRRIRPSYKQLMDSCADVDAVVFLTAAQRADAEAKYGRRDNFSVIPHAARPAEPHPGLERDPHLVVMLARLDQQKQLDHAIKAFAKVSKQVPEARLTIYGRGPEDAALAALIKKLDLDGVVTLGGYTSDPGAVYQGAAMSMLTSAFEGFGLVVLESLSNGCPVVSYDLKYGPSDIISHGQNGFLVPADDIDALARQTVAILTDPALQARLSAAAPRAMAAFEPAPFVARWSDLFSRLDKQGWQ